MTIGDRIKHRRKALGLNQEELGMRLGYKKAAVCRLETEESNLRTERLLKISKALETTPGYLMGWDNGSIDAIVESSEEDAEFLSIYNSLDCASRHLLLEVARRIYGSTN